MTAGILSVCTVLYILKFILFYLSFTLVHISWPETLPIRIPLTLDEGGWPKHVAALTNTLQQCILLVRYSIILSHTATICYKII
jgi:hypothetical protein